MTNTTKPATEWIIQVRDDVDSEWVSACSVDVDSDVYETKKAAQKRMRELRDIGMLMGYDAARVVEVAA